MSRLCACLVFVFLFGTMASGQIDPQHLNCTPVPTCILVYFVPEDPPNEKYNRMGVIWSWPVVGADGQAFTYGADVSFDGYGHSSWGNDHFADDATDNTEQEAEIASHCPFPGIPQ